MSPGEKMIRLVVEVREAFGAFHLENLEEYMDKNFVHKEAADKLAEALEQIIASYEYGDEDFMREPGDPDFIQNMEIIARQALKEYRGEK
jgi:hypothetical protein